jgi:hypothetical protein
MMDSDALDRFGMYVLVDGLSLWKCYIWSSLMSWIPFMLNLCLGPCSFHMGSKTYVSSWMFRLQATSWRSLSFFLPQRHLMYHA